MSTFQSLTSIDEIRSFMAKHDITLIFISREHCSICHSLLPQIEKIMTYFPKIATAHVSADQVPEVAGRFSIFTVPVVLVFVEQSEYYRGARIVPLAPFEAKIKQLYNGYYY